jgi:deoxyadenosine/deoxycytidine kinase
MAARLEQNLYAQIPPPDLVVRLKVSLETAKARNHLRNKPGGETDEYLESRHKHSSKWLRTDTVKVYEVDTEQSLALTKLQIKSIIWHSI